MTVDADYSADFGDLDGRTWMNAAGQGPLPRCAAEVAYAAVADKMNPRKITPGLYLSAAEGLRHSLAELLNGNVDDIFLGNSVTYGLSVVANGLEWSPGDEVVVVVGDYPTCAYPWLPLRKRGVTVRAVRPSGAFLTPEDLAGSLSPRTRVFCTNWVNSFLGHALDTEGIGQVCAANGTLFVLNAAQAAGARALDVTAASADMISGCGYKWLCGPYGTGFGWLAPKMHDLLTTDPCYWYAMASDEDGSTEAAARHSFRADLQFAPRTDLPKAARFDVFNTPNFLTFMPWRESLDYLNKIGIGRIAEHDKRLVAALLDGIPRGSLVVNSPEDDEHSSTLVVVAHRDPSRTAQVASALSGAGIDVTFRFGNIRISPHIYNTMNEVDKVAEILKSAA